MDDPWVSCPYDPVHRVSRSRLQGHIIKCEKQYPKLSICPYNATHRMQEKDLKNHLQECPARQEMFPDKLSRVSYRPPRSHGFITTPKPILEKEYLTKDDPEFEVWDD